MRSAGLMLMSHGPCADLLVFHATFYPVLVHRPVPSRWTSSPPRLAAVQLPFRFPSASPSPGAGTCTPQVPCHARHATVLRFSKAARGLWKYVSSVLFGSLVCEHHGDVGHVVPLNGFFHFFYLQFSG